MQILKGPRSEVTCPRLLIYLLAIWIIKLHFLSLAPKFMIFPVPCTNSKDWHLYMFFTYLHALTSPPHTMEAAVTSVCCVHTTPSVFLLFQIWIPQNTGLRSRNWVTGSSDYYYQHGGWHTGCAQKVPLNPAAVLMMANTVQHWTTCGMFYLQYLSWFLQCPLCV